MKIKKKDCTLFINYELVEIHKDKIICTLRGLREVFALPPLDSMTLYDAGLSIWSMESKKTLYREFKKTHNKKATYISKGKTIETKAFKEWMRKRGESDE